MVHFTSGMPFIPRRLEPVADVPPREPLELFLQVKALPQMGNVISDPETLGLIQDVRKQGISDLTLMDPEGQQMTFHFPPMF